VNIGGHNVAKELGIGLVAVQKVLRMAVADAHIVDQHTDIQASGFFADLVVDLGATGEVHIDHAHLHAVLIP